MNRRGFITATGAFAGLGLLPSWRAFKQRRQIDMTPFCDDDHYPLRRFDLRQPFAQDGMVYATDARIMCRTTLADAPELAEGTRLPGASTLSWWKEADVRWKPWPKASLFTDGYRYGDTCPRCYGKGVFGRVHQCQMCEGLGEVGDQSAWGAGFDMMPCKLPCKLCCESGYMGDVRCDYCGGSGQTHKPALQRIGSLVVAGHYDARVRALGDVEYAICDTQPTQVTDPMSLVKFRGDGVDGLLMPLMDRGGA